MPSRRFIPGLLRANHLRAFTMVRARCPNLRAGCPRFPALFAVPSDEFVDEVFQEFLPAAGAGRRLALFKREGFERLEGFLPGFDVRAQTGVPRGIALL